MHYEQYPLHAACVKQDLNAVKDLLKNGESANARAEDGNTPLHVCVLNGAIDIITHLFEQRFELKLDYTIRNNAGFAPLELLLAEIPSELGPLAYTIDAEKFIKIDWCKEGPWYRMPNGAAIWSECYQHLLLDAYYTDTDAKRSGLQTILAFKRHFDPVLQKDFLVNPEDPDGTTPLYLLCKNQQWAAAAHLIQQGASLVKIYAPGKSPLEYLAKYTGSDPLYYQLMRDILSTDAKTEDSDLTDASFSDLHKERYMFVAYFVQRHPLANYFLATSADSLSYAGYIDAWVNDQAETALKELYQLVHQSDVAIENVLCIVKPALRAALQHTINHYEQELQTCLLQKYPALADTPFSDIKKLIATLIQGITATLPWQQQNAHKLAENYEHAGYVAFEVIYHKNGKQRIDFCVLYNDTLCISRRGTSYDGYEVDLSATLQSMGIVTGTGPVLASGTVLVGGVLLTPSMIPTANLDNSTCNKPNPLYFSQKFTLNDPSQFLDLLQLRFGSSTTFGQWQRLLLSQIKSSVNSKPVHSYCSKDNYYAVLCHGLLDYLIDQVAPHTEILPEAQRFLCDSLLRCNYLYIKQSYSIAITSKFRVPALLEEHVRYNIFDNILTDEFKAMHAQDCSNEAHRNNGILFNSSPLHEDLSIGVALRKTRNCFYHEFTNDLVEKTQNTLLLGLALRVSPQLLTEPKLSIAQLRAMEQGYSYEQIANLSQQQLDAIAAGATIQEVQQPWFNSNCVELIKELGIIDANILAVVNAAQVYAMTKLGQSFATCNDMFFDDLFLQTQKACPNEVKWLAGTPSYISTAQHAAQKIPKEIVEDPTIGTPHIAAMCLHGIPYDIVCKLNLTELLAIQFLGISQLTPSAPCDETFLLPSLKGQADILAPLLSEICGSELSLEKILTLRLNGTVHLIDIGTDKAVRETAKLVEYTPSNPNFDWLDLLAYISASTTEELLQDIYRAPHSVTNELNQLQLAGLCLGFSVEHVTSSIFSIERLFAAIFFGANPNYLMALGDEQLTKALPKSLTPFIDKYGRDLKITKPAKLQVSNPGHDTIYECAAEVPCDKEPIYASNDNTSLANALKDECFALVMTDHDAALLDQEFATACKNGAWDKARVLLLQGANIRKSYPWGESPLETIAFNDNATPEYIKFLKFFIVFLGDDLKLDFTERFGINEPLLSAIAAYQPLDVRYYPEPDDHPNYHKVFKILREMRLKTLIHNQFGFIHWYYAAADEYSFKPTGSIGAVMHREFMEYHRACMLSERDAFLGFQKELKINVESLIYRIDEIFRNYLPTKIDNWSQLSDKIARCEPVAFEVQIMLNLFSHNLNMVVDDRYLYICDRSTSGVKIFTITNRQALTQQLKTIFGRRVSRTIYDKFKSNPYMNEKSICTMQMQTGYNCTFCSMHALYAGVVLSRLLATHHSKHTDIDTQKIYEFGRIANSWSELVCSYGLYMNLIEHDQIAKTPLLLPADKAKLKPFEPPKNIINAILKCSSLDAIGETLARRFLEQKPHHAKLAGFKLSKPLESIPNHNLLYDLGPSVEEKAYRLTSDQLLGLNYGLEEETVTTAGFQSSFADLLFRFPSQMQRIKKLTVSQRLALEVGFTIDQVDTPLFEPWHLDLAQKTAIRNIRRLLAFNSWQRDAITSRAAPLSDVENKFFNHHHMEALRVNKSSFSVTQLCQLPGYIAYGLAKGLSVDDVFSANYSSFHAQMLCRLNTVFSQIKDLTPEQVRLCLYLKINQPNLGDPVLQPNAVDDLKILYLMFDNIIDPALLLDSLKLKKQLLCQHPNYALQILRIPGCNWLHILAHMKNLKQEQVETYSQLQLLWYCIAAVTKRNIPVPTDVQITYNLIRCAFGSNHKLETLQGLEEHQLLGVLQGLDISEVRQSWYSEQHSAVCRKFGLNPRYLLGRDAEVMLKLQEQIMQARPTISKLTLAS